MLGENNLKSVRNNTKIILMVIIFWVLNDTNIIIVYLIPFKPTFSGWISAHCFALGI